MLPKKKGWQAQAPHRYSQQHNFDAVPAPRHPHHKTSPLPEGAGGCSHIPSKLGEATSGGESPCPWGCRARCLPCPHTEIRALSPTHHDSPLPACLLPVSVSFHGVSNTLRAA